MMYLIRGDYVSKELNEILKIEDELGYLFEDKELINDNEAKKIGDKLLSLLKKSKANVIVGGGDAASSVRNLGYEDAFTYIC